MSATFTRGTYRHLVLGEHCAGSTLGPAESRNLEHVRSWQHAKQVLAQDAGLRHRMQELYETMRQAWLEKTPSDDWQKQNPSVAWFFGMYDAVTRDSFMRMYCDTLPPIAPRPDADYWYDLDPVDHLTIRF